MYPVRTQVERTLKQEWIIGHVEVIGWQTTQAVGQLGSDVM